MDSGLSSAIGGVSRAFDVHAQRAERITRAPEGEDFVRDMAELPTDGTAVKANTAVIRTQDQMLGALLDLFG